MVKSVDQGFREFHSRLTPTGTESEAAKRHRASIKSCLEGNFGITNFFRTGSFGNGTSIRGYSDVDYFAVIPNENLTNNSGTTLRKVRTALDLRFPNTGVMVRTPAVVVPFGTDASETTEIVPAEDMGIGTTGYKIYDIPDFNEEWMKSSPTAHNRWITSVHQELGNKVKPLVRFLKAWKYFRNVPISSFYLELRVTKFASGESHIIYSYDVRSILKLLWDNQLAAIQDPMKVSGNVYPCLTDTKKRDALSKLWAALTRANKAREAETEEKIQDAFYWWNLLYEGHFPSYR